MFVSRSNIRRGDVYYISKSGTTAGCEQGSGRPAVVVSNDTNNRFSPVVEVVYCTTKPKPPLPTHVYIHATPVRSLVLCEQVTSVSVERLGNYIGRCSVDEMKQIDKAISVSLGLKESHPLMQGEPRKVAETHVERAIFIKNALTGEYDGFLPIKDGFEAEAYNKSLANANKINATNGYTYDLTDVIVRQRQEYISYGEWSEPEGSYSLEVKLVNAAKRSAESEQGHSHKENAFMMG